MTKEALKLSCRLKKKFKNEQFYKNNILSLIRVYDNRIYQETLSSRIFMKGNAFKDTKHKMSCWNPWHF